MDPVSRIIYNTGVGGGKFNEFLQSTKEKHVANAKRDYNYIIEYIHKSKAIETTLKHKSI